MTGSQPGSTRPLISADSHVIEPLDVWKGVLAEGFWGDEPAMFSARPGGFDPKARMDEMATDGVSAEVLYPSIAMRLFGLEDPELQRACFRRYNEWLAEYCSVRADRLIGVGLIPAYGMDAALEEFSWCQAHGLRNVQVWQTPPPELAFSSSHYEPLWEACAEAGASVSLHILTGFGYALPVYKYGKSFGLKGDLHFKTAISRKLAAVQDDLLELLLWGALDRHRGLKVVLVENECAWLPFFVDQVDFYQQRFGGRTPVPLERAPSQAFADQVFTTFFRDPNAALVVQSMGSSNLMWSSDYPHGNSTWPESQQVVQDRLGALGEEAIREVVWNNARRVFGIPVEPLSDQASD
jgi:predicted TIM-barrel fold metal-dependent hydrolase